MLFTVEFAIGPCRREPVTHHTMERSDAGDLTTNAVAWRLAALLTPRVGGLLQLLPFDATLRPAPRVSKLIRQRFARLRFRFPATIPPNVSYVGSIHVDGLQLAFLL